ncbi:MAG: YaeQ family protein [Betaproteobacteria bacterium]|nr:MAG: YaeQ family protein [Betaproteobacteria bacterium]
MALKATIFKVELQIADMDRHYYADHALTLARHPSETDERMMVRLFAFARYAHEYLDFAKGLSVDDEPDLWQQDLTGAIDLWIDVGLPDERRVRKACGRARQVVIVTYGQRAADIWWGQNSKAFAKQDNLTVLGLSTEASQGLAALAQRTMRLQCTVQDGEMWLTDGAETVHIVPTMLQGARA